MAIAALSVVGSTLSLAPHTPNAAAPLVPASTPAATLVGMTLSDGQSVKFPAAGKTITLTDTITPGAYTPGQRNYTIKIVAQNPTTAYRVTLSTNPVGVWSGVHSFPWGPANLPPLANWTWSVTRSTLDVTSRWSANPDGTISRTIAAENFVFHVTGRPQLAESVHVYPFHPDGTNATSTGFMMMNPGVQGGIPAGDSDFSALTNPLNPYLIRVGLPTVSNVTWNVLTNTPTFNLRNLGKFVNFSVQAGAKLYLSLPCGNWGDGNLLPLGMPLNLTQVISFGPRTGYFPDESAWAVYVKTLAQDIHQLGWNITYWNIGNEVPTKNGASVETAYIQLFNSAAQILHNNLPDAQVGSDIMMQQSEFASFAQLTHGVDFLSFHYYPVNVSCPTLGTYCIPNDSQGYLRDASFWAANHTLTGVHFVAPAMAQQEWYNATGNWIPVIDSESNFAKGMVFGTDPRAQSLLGAVWLSNTLIDASRQNVSAFTYYSFEAPTTTPATATGPYGGWGWGLTSEGTSDNDTKFAPYYALEVWGQQMSGMEGIRVSTSDPSVLPAYAVLNGSYATVAVVNRMSVDTTVHLTLPGGQRAPIDVYTLDANSYKMHYNSTGHRVQLYQSSMSSRTLPGTQSLTVSIYGYGVAFIRFHTNASSLWFAPSGGLGSSASGPRATAGSPTGASGSRCLPPGTVDAIVAGPGSAFPHGTPARNPTPVAGRAERSDR